MVAPLPLEKKPKPMHPDYFTDPELCTALVQRLTEELDAPFRFMEVCGTHTVSIFRSGLRSLLPQGITHLSGPGCPVCVTHDREIAACLALAEKENIIIATFGDMLRVPGPEGMSLKKAQAAGAQISLVYSPLDALALASTHKDKQIVFLGIGFETTAPAVAATILLANTQNIPNFTVLSLHKLVPPALAALASEGSSGDSSKVQGTKTSPLSHIDGFLLPGHVSTILGIAPYSFLAERYNKPGVIGGFEAVDILQSLLLLVRMRKEGKATIINQYQRAVDDAGNPHAKNILFQVFEERDALWRGLGMLPMSGLAIRDFYANFDAWKKFSLELPDVPEIKGCRCGDVLKGMLSPEACPLFGTACTPAMPVGPCMVSSEGSCAAYFTYQGDFSL